MGWECVPPPLQAPGTASEFFTEMNRVLRYSALGPVKSLCHHRCGARKRLPMQWPVVQSGASRLPSLSAQAAANAVACAGWCFTLASAPPLPVPASNLPVPASNLPVPAPDSQHQAARDPLSTVHHMCGSAHSHPMPAQDGAAGAEVQPACHAEHGLGVPFSQKAALPPLHSHPLPAQAGAAGAEVQPARHAEYGQGVP